MPPTDIRLRDYQAKMMAEAHEHMRAGVRRIIMQLPTGGGKRIIGVDAIARAVERGKRCGFAVHRQELLDQAVATIEGAGLRCGVIKAGVRPDYDWPIQVASIQTLAHRLDKTAPFDFLVIDEIHHARASTWEQVMAAYPQAYIIGFSATPRRLDGRGLGRWFDALVQGPSMRELIDAGYLADYRIFAPPAPDLSDVPMVGGDFNRGKQAAIVDQTKIVGDVVEHYKRYAAGTQAICFGVNIAHSRHLAQAFWTAGILARHVDADTPAGERTMAIEDFAARRFQVLTNCDLFGEGVDIAGIETVICARQTQSITVYLQQVGRAMRVKLDGRKAIVLDHANNSTRHGLPDDPRDWSLSDDTKRKPSKVNIKICPACFAAVRSHVRICPECGHLFVTETVEVEHAEGELVEIDRQARQLELALAVAKENDEWRRKRSEVESATTIAELRRIAAVRGYKRGWAKHVARGKGIAS